MCSEKHLNKVILQVISITLSIYNVKIKLHLIILIDLVIYR